MFTFPTLPSWDEAHPLIVHFPIALLMTAPVLVILALLWKSAIRPLSVAALCLMLLGTTGAFIAVEAGEAAEEHVESNPAAKPVLEDHSEMGETTRTIFAVLTGVYAVLAVGPFLLRKKCPCHRTVVIAQLVFLVPYGAGMLALANTAHLGGRLVHEIGVESEDEAAEEHAPAPDLPSATLDDEEDKDGG